MIFSLLGVLTGFVESSVTLLCSPGLQVFEEHVWVCIVIGGMFFGMWCEISKGWGGKTCCIVSKG